MYQPQFKPTQEQEQKAKDEVKKWTDYCKENSPDGNWRNSTIFWTLINKDRTYEQIFNSELASIVFFDECHKLGYYGGPEIEAALRKGEIPVPAIEAVLIYESGLGGNDYPAIAEGYRGRLHPEVQSVLENHNGYEGNSPMVQAIFGDYLQKKLQSEGIDNLIGFLYEIGQIQRNLHSEGISPDVSFMPVHDKIIKILEARGLTLDEALERYRTVGEI